jgi:hypothetical protein
MLKKSYISKGKNKFQGMIDKYADQYPQYYEPLQPYMENIQISQSSTSIFIMCLLLCCICIYCLLSSCNLSLFITSFTNGWNDLTMGINQFLNDQISVKLTTIIMFFSSCCISICLIFYLSNLSKK